MDVRRGEFDVEGVVNLLVQEFIRPFLGLGADVSGRARAARFHLASPLRRELRRAPWPRLVAQGVRYRLIFETIQLVVDRGLRAVVALGERLYSHPVRVGERDHEPRRRLRIVDVKERCPHVHGRDSLLFAQWRAAYRLYPIAFVPCSPMILVG